MDKAHDWLIPNSIDGEPFCHLLCVGKTRYGKNGFLTRVATSLFKNRGVKIYDIHSGGKMEGPHAMFPSDLEYWKEQRLDIDGAEVKPEGMPVRVLMPYSDYLPKNLPHQFQPFTIPTNEMTIKCWQSLLGMEVRTEANTWNVVKFKIDKKTSAPEMVYELSQAHTEEVVLKTGAILTAPTVHGGKSLTIGISDFLDQKVFSSANFPLALTTDEIKKDMRGDWITVLETSQYQDHANFFVYYLIEKIWELKRTGVVRRPVVILMRESQDFIPKQEMNLKEAATKKLIGEILEKGAGKRLYFALDSQSPSFIELFAEQFGIVACFRLDSYYDIDNFLGPKVAAYSSKELKSKVYTLPKYHAVIFLPWGIRSGYVVPPTCALAKSGEDFWVKYKSFSAREPNNYWYRNWEDQYKALKNEYEEGVKRTKEIVVLKKYRKEKEKEKKEAERLKVRTRTAPHEKKIELSQEELDNLEDLPFLPPDD